MTYQITCKDQMQAVDAMVALEHAIAAVGQQAVNMEHAIRRDDARGVIKTDPSYRLLVSNQLFYREQERVLMDLRAAAVQAARDTAKVEA